MSEAAGGFKPQLDGLRAIAILLVLLDHSLPPLHPLMKIGPGFLGVRLFFVISGYLITAILLSAKQSVREGTSSVRWSLRQFYARRFLRIFPLYYLVLGVLLILQVPAFLEQWPWHVFYASNLLLVREDAWVPLLGPLWSLSVEEQFYLAWPLLVLLVPARYVGALVVAAIGAGLLSRGLMAGAGFGGVATRSLTTSCMDILGAGALLAVVERYRPALRPRLVRGSLAAGIALFLPLLALRLGEGSWAVRAVFLDFSAALLFLWAVGRAAEGSLPRLMQNGALRYVGKVSYGIYLFHALLPALIPGFPDKGWPHFAALTAACVALAAISWRCFEGPLNGLKRYFPYGLSRT